MKELVDIIRKVEALLISLNYKILETLQVGIKDDQIEMAQRFQILKLPFREDIWQLYRWRNGAKNLQQTNIEQLELFPYGIMLPFEFATSIYLLETGPKKSFKKTFFPLFTGGGGDYILIDLNENSSSFGCLFLFSPSVLLTNKPIIIYDSIFNLFLTLDELYGENAYYFNQSNNLEVDYALEKLISQKLNPKSNFWEEE